MQFTQTTSPRATPDYYFLKNQKKMSRLIYLHAELICRDLLLELLFQIFFVRNCEKRDVEIFFTVLNSSVILSSNQVS